VRSILARWRAAKWQIEGTLPPRPDELEVRQLDDHFRETEQGWQVILPDDVPVPGDSMDDVDCSTLWLLEDDIPIGPPHVAHQDIVERGMGRYSHWGRSLWFSTADGSDPNTNGRRYAIAWERPEVAGSAGIANRSHPVLDMLGDILRARGVCRLVYFHTDHFEPFHSGRDPAHWIALLRRFARLTARDRFAGRMSLFYTPRLVLTLTQTPTSEAPDGIAFEYPTDDHLALCRNLIRPLEAEIGHEFHVHLHHEGWTASDHTFPHLEAFVHGAGAGCRDSRSLDTYLSACRLAMEAELGRRFAAWGFVHGNWALNGSNPAYCRIEDELGILKRHGCYGDFTFPAGDWHNDPALKAPFTCATPSELRAYDRETSAPRSLSRHAGDLGGDRLLVWSSRLDATRSSLDLYQPHFLALLKQPEFILRDWFAGAPVIDSCLYIKTHAHSADAHYALWEDDAHIPHSFGPVRDLFDLLERAADRARLPLTVATVDEVMRDLRAFDDPSGAR